MIKNLYLIRHCESQHHVLGMTGGWTDLPLTERGQRQAELTARRLRRELGGDAVSSLYTSDLQRAAQTARSIADELGLSPIPDPGLRELNQGVAVNLHASEAAALHREPTEPILDWVPYEAGESWRMMYERMGQTLDRIERSEAGTVLIVGHGNALICAIHWWLRITEDHHIRDIMYQLDPGSVTHLCVDGHGCRAIAYMNDSCHLPRADADPDDDAEAP